MDKSYSIHTLSKNSKVAFLHTYCQPTTLTTNFGPPPSFIHSGEVLSSHAISCSYFLVGKKYYEQVH